jgi:hypothetical protein
VLLLLAGGPGPCYCCSMFVYSCTHSTFYALSWTLYSAYTMCRTCTDATAPHQCDHAATPPVGMCRSVHPAGSLPPPQVQRAGGRRQQAPQCGRGPAAEHLKGERGQQQQLHVCTAHKWCRYRPYVHIIARSWVVVGTVGWLCSKTMVWLYT